MEGQAASNFDTLLDAGLIVRTPLPQAYEEAIEKLSEHEIEALISVKRRFDKAQGTLEPGAPPYREFVVAF